MRLRGFLAGAALLAGIAGFLALGVWQVERRAWKLDLIARVEARVAAAPVAAPGPADWPGIGAETDEYRRVQATGRFLHDREVAVQAVTVLGPGYWIVTPLQTPDFTLLVNRGFVPADRREAATRAEGQVAGEVGVTGLLRLSEPGVASCGATTRRRGGGIRATWRRSPRTAAWGRWHRISSTPMRRPIPGGLPVGGLTVIRFRNSHLVYALTWFALAGGLAAGGIIALRRRED